MVGSGMNENGRYTNHLDTESKVKIDSTVVQVWIRTTYVNPATYTRSGRTVTYKELFFRWSLDCARRRLRVEELVYQDLSGPSLSAPGSESWFSVIPETDGERFLVNGCQ